MQIFYLGFFHRSVNRRKSIVADQDINNIELCPHLLNECGRVLQTHGGGLRMSGEVLLFLLIIMKRWVLGNDMVAIVQQRFDSWRAYKIEDICYQSSFVAHNSLALRFFLIIHSF